MAFSSGDFITASGLNQINGSASFSGTLGDSSDWIQNSIGNDGVFFSHRQSGSLLFTGYFKCGMFGGGNFRVKKWVSGGWNETVYSADFGWNTNTTVNVNSTGPGKYRVYSESAFQFAAIPWSIFCGQTDCTTGKFLTVYDGFRSSLNSLPGTPITAAICNSQRAGTLGI